MKIFVVKKIYLSAANAMSLATFSGFPVSHGDNLFYPISSYFITLRHAPYSTTLGTISSTASPALELLIQSNMAAAIPGSSGQITRNGQDIPSKVLLWSEEEAELKQIEQVGVSACGATAALNVLVGKNTHNISFISV